MVKAVVDKRTGTSIATAAVLIMLGNAASRLLGLGREQVIAALFGQTGATDAFVAANTVPTMLYDLVVAGAVSAALIPVFSGYVGTREEDLRRVAGTILTLTTIVLALAVAVLWLFADQVMAVLGGGFAPGDRALAIDLVHLALPAVIFLGLSGVVTAILYARQVFVYSAFCAATYNAGMIAMALLLAPRFGVASLAAGVLIGAILQLAVQTPGLRGLGLRPALDLRHPGVQRILLLYAPVAIGLVVSQVGVAIDRNLASRAGEGAMAAMRFATTLVQLPLGLIVTATSYAVLPSLSRFAAVPEPERPASVATTPAPAAAATYTLAGDGATVTAPPADDGRGEGAEAYRRTLSLGIRFSLFFILPAMVGLVALRGPLVALVFQHGVFAAADTARTAWILLFYLPQLPFVAVDQLLIFAFYARKNTLTPMLVGVLGVGIYLVAGLNLLGPMQAAGLALANTLQHTVHATVLFVLLSREVGGLADRRLGSPLARLALAAAVTGLALYLLGPVLVAMADLASFWGQLTYLLAATTVGGTVYLAAAVALRCEEISLAVSLLRRLANRGAAA
ncbi:MAG: murein biosynthesis integral membrane protein MurJ [Chloroflexota bacterium]